MKVTKKSHSGSEKPECQKNRKVLFMQVSKSAFFTHCSADRVFQELQNDILNLSISGHIAA